MATSKESTRNKKSEYQDPLFELIKSMSATEKRYFIVRAEKIRNIDGNIPDYYILFQLLVKREFFNEKEVAQELLKKVGKKSFSNFTVKKNELYDALMKRLKSYHFNKSKKSADYIKVLLQDSNFLFKRGLYQQANKKIRAARKMAEKCGDTLSLIEMNRLEREFLRTNRVVKMEKRLEELHQEEKKLIKDLTVEAERNKDYDNLLAKLLTKNRLTNKKDVEQLKSEYNHLEKFLDGKDLPIQAERFLLSSLISYYYLLGNNEQADSLMKLVFQWWKNNNLWKEKMPHYYISALSNVLSTYNREKNYSEFLKTLEILEKFDINTQHEKTLRFYFLMHQRLMYYLNSGLINEACSLSKRIEKGLKVNNLSEANHIMLINNVVIAHFLNSNFLECIRWIKFYKPFKKMARGKLKIQFSQILKLIAYYELGDMNNFDKTYGATLRYLSGIMNVDPLDFDMVMLSQIYKLNNALPKEQKYILKEIRDYLQSFSNQYKRVGREELFFWVNSKLENKSMKNLLLEQIKNSP